MTTWGEWRRVGKGSAGKSAESKRKDTECSGWEDGNQTLAKSCSFFQIGNHIVDLGETIEPRKDC